MPILQEYDIFIIELVSHPVESGKLAARHNIVEIEKASWNEAKYSNWMARHPAIVQRVEIVDVRC